MTTLKRTTSEIRQATFEQEAAQTNILSNIKPIAASVFSHISSAVDSFIEANENFTPTQEAYIARKVIEQLNDENH